MTYASPLAFETLEQQRHRNVGLFSRFKTDFLKDLKLADPEPLREPMRRVRA